MSRAVRFVDGGDGPFLDRGDGPFSGSSTHVRTNSGRGCVVGGYRKKLVDIVA